MSFLLNGYLTITKKKIENGMDKKIAQGRFSTETYIIRIRGNI